MPLSIGVDIGGTKILAGVVDDEGTIIATALRATAKRDADAALAQVAEVVAELRAEYAVTALGLGVAGGVSNDRSFVYFAPNLVWADVPVGEIVRAATELPVVVENDGSAAAWGEFRFGAGREVDDCLMITLGTGIGAGHVAAGQLVRGAHGLAFEVGHMNAIPDGRPCGCGRRGCWEQYASGSALVRMARELAAEHRGEATVLLDMGDGTPEGVLGEHVTAAARAGDPVARQAFSEFGMWVGRGLADLTAIVDPGMFVIGGGVSDAADLFVADAQTVLEERVFGRMSRPLPVIRMATMGNAAGLVGAADLARRHVEGQTHAQG
jgi:glucokinase